MPTTPSTSNDHHLTLIRILAAAIAMVVALDVVDVGAPGLAMLAIPFIVAAIALRRGGPVATTLLLLWSLLFAVIGVNWAVNDIGDSFVAGWGDSLFGYVGTPLAAAASALLLARERQLRANKRHTSILAS